MSSIASRASATRESIAFGSFSSLLHPPAPVGHRFLREGFGESKSIGHGAHVPEQEKAGFLAPEIRHSSAVSLFSRGQALGNPGGCTGLAGPVQGYLGRSGERLIKAVSVPND